MSARTRLILVYVNSLCPELGLGRFALASIPATAESLMAAGNGNQQTCYAVDSDDRLCMAWIRDSANRVITKNQSVALNSWVELTRKSLFKLLLSQRPKIGPLWTVPQCLKTSLAQSSAGILSYCYIHTMFWTCCQHSCGRRNDYTSQCLGCYHSNCYGYV